MNQRRKYQNKWRDSFETWSITCPDKDTIKKNHNKKIVQMEKVCTQIIYDLAKWLLFIAWQNDRRRKKCWKIFFLVAKWIFARNLLAVWTSKVYFQNFLIRMNTLFSNAKAHLLREQSLVHSEMKYTVTPRRENQMFICLVTGMQIAMSFRESKWMNYFKCSKHIEISAT